MASGPESFTDGTSAKSAALIAGISSIKLNNKVKGQQEHLSTSVHMVVDGKDRELHAVSL